MYCAESSGPRKGCTTAEPTTELSKKRRGRPLVLDEEIVEQVKLFLKGIRRQEVL